MDKKISFINSNKNLNYLGIRNVHNWRGKLKNIPEEHKSIENCKGVGGP